MDVYVNLNPRLLIFLILILVNAFILYFRVTHKNDAISKSELIFSIVMFILAVISFFIGEPHELLSVASIIFLIDIKNIIRNLKRQAK